MQYLRVSLHKKKEEKKRTAREERERRVRLPEDVEKGEERSASEDNSSNKKTRSTTAAMFALRSSPSSLVCDLRNTLLPAEGGFQLSAPRPRRASVRLGFDIYYAGADGGEADGGGLGSGGGGSAFSPAVSDYAGVFEVGDPARARESMNNNIGGEPLRPSGLVEERAPRYDDADHCVGGNGRREGGFLAAAAGTGERGAVGGSGAPGAFALDDHGEGDGPEDEGGLEEDFLFEMEGLKEANQDEGMRVVPNGSSSGRTGVGGAGWGAAAAATAAGASFSHRGAGGRGEAGASSGNALRKVHGTPPTHASPSSPSAGEKQHTGTGRGHVGGGAAVATGAPGVGGGGVALRKPRVMAPRGTRCIGGGMYRLRLSTSC